MKPIKLILILMPFISTTLTMGQNFIYNMEKDNCILKDSLWIKQNIWEEAKLYNDFKIKKSDALNVNFYSFPIYKFNKKVRDYNYDMDFESFLTKDNTRVAGFILYSGGIVGFLSGYQKNGKWLASPVEIFSDQSPLKIAFELISSNKITAIYSINPLGSICYTLNNHTFIFDSFYKKFIKIEDYIQERVTLNTLHNYSIDNDGLKNSLQHN